MTRSRVAVIGTGGTIASVGRSKLDLGGYVSTGIVLPIEDLLALVPEVHEVADVTPVPFSAIPSTAVGETEWRMLVARIEELAAERPAFDGIVVTHGTATLEETAYFLDLVLKVDVPVVFVGAQRPSSGISTDGYLNLVNAVRVAGSPAARGMGTLVCLNDEIHAAREVTKTSTFRLQTFQSPEFGVLGHADPDNVVFYRKPLRRRAPDTELALPHGSLPRVEIIYSWAGSNGRQITDCIARGVDGLVSAGFAPGLTTPDETKAFAEASESGIIIVQSNRSGSGRVIEVEGRRAPRTVVADNLNPQKARILLMLAMTRSRDPVAIQRMFDTH